MQHQPNITHDFWETITPIRLIDKKTGEFVIPATGVATAAPFNIPLVVAQFNYTAASNLTIKPSSIPQQPTLYGQNFNIAIRYTNAAGGVTRYKLWNISTNPMVDIQATFYTGQPIAKNFTVEIWAVNNVLALNFNVPITLSTSNLMTKETLVDCDTFNIASGSLCTTLSDIDNIQPIQPDTTNCAFWFDATTGIETDRSTPPNIEEWTDKIGSFSVAPTSNMPTYSLGSKISVNFVGDQYLDSGDIMPISILGTMYIVVQCTTWESAKQIVTFYSGITQFSLQNGTVANTLCISNGFTTQTTQITKSFGHFILIEIQDAGGVLNVFDMTDGVLLESYSVLDSTLPNHISEFTFGDTTGTTQVFNLYHFAGYTQLQTAAARIQTIQWFLNNYAVAEGLTFFSLPIQFAPCAVGPVGTETLTITQTMQTATSQFPTPPAYQVTTPAAATMPLVGTNFRYNPTTGNLEFLNVTTGKYNPIVTEGASGAESIEIESQE